MHAIPQAGTRERTTKVNGHCEFHGMSLEATNASRNVLGEKRQLIGLLCLNLDVPQILFTGKDDLCLSFSFLPPLIQKELHKTTFP